MTTEIKTEHLKSLYRYDLLVDGQNKGFLLLSKRHQVCEVIIDEDVRGKGFGKLLYETALKELGSISTYYDMASPFAQAVWQSLMKRYKSSSKIRSGETTVYNESF